MGFVPADLRLSVQRGLVGQISPRLIGTCVEHHDKQIALTFYVAADLTDEERDDLTTVGTMVLGDYPDDFTIHEEFVIATVGTPLRTRGDWVLLQRGFLTVEG